jgi:4a-hydroxytetrahydrobiopterin dehydratase
MALLDEDAIARGLAQAPEWQRDGDAIVKTATLADFKEAMAYVNQIAEIAEERNHHPDITIQWNKITLSLSTHSAGGLTDNDFDLARRIDAL